MLPSLSNFYSLVVIAKTSFIIGEGNGTPLQYLCLENPWTEEPGKLQSLGSKRVGCDWATSLSLFTFMLWRRKWQPTPVFLPGESQGRGAWWAAVCGVAQSRTWMKRLSSSSSIYHQFWMWSKPVSINHPLLSSWNPESSAKIKNLISYQFTLYVYFVVRWIGKIFSDKVGLALIGGGDV